MMLGRALARAGMAAGIGLASLASPLTAQEAAARLTGLLVTEGTGAPVTGAIVALVDEGGAVLGETLSTEVGTFSLPQPPPGAYRVRVTRIGYESWASGILRLAPSTDPATLRFEVPVRPIPLPELSVTEKNDCPTTPEERRRAFELYESVLPILANVSSTEDLGVLRMRMVRPIKVWKRGRFRRSYDTATVVVSKSLNNTSPAWLEAHGYAEVLDDTTTTFYAPDGDALASPGFLATHCLNTVAGKNETTVGLSFEPRPGRVPVDVAGVLWIDAATSEPQALEFRYTSLRPFLRRNLVPVLRANVRARRPNTLRYTFHRVEIHESWFGGVLYFERIPGTDDRWLIREWKIARPELTHRFRIGYDTPATVWPVANPLRYSGEVLALIRR